MPKPISAKQLRKLAEMVDGHRGAPMVIVWRADELLVIPKRDFDPGTDTLVLDCLTKDEVEKRPKFDHLKIKTKTKEEDIKEKYDALFWSEAAVQKFALPYYQSHLSTTEVDKIWTGYLSDEVYALAHLPKSDSDVIKDLAKEDGINPLNYSFEFYTDIESKGKPRFMPVDEFWEKKGLIAAPGTTDPAQ